MKKILFLGITISLFGSIIVFFNPITDFLAQEISRSPKLVINPGNSYTKNKDYLFVQRSKDYIPYSYQDLLNIVYSVLDNGWDTFTFYCPKEYTYCLEDIEKISDDEITFSHINNYVHPFNSATNIDTYISPSGEITFNITHLYNKEEIALLEKETDRILEELINPDLEEYDKIKTIHDYIVNNVKYDVVRNENEKSKYNSNTAYGVIIEGYGICNGYTDALAIFLTKLGYDNYKIATTPELISYSKSGHVWNAVNFEGNWLHIDLTWDDPVSNDGKDYLFHTYFLVNNEAMVEADKGETTIEEHNYEKKYYLEFK